MRLSEDAAGTPGVTCASWVEAYRGLGQLHARLRPIQTLCMATAARGRLMADLWPTPQTQHVDWAVARLDFGAKAKAALAHLDADARALLDAYVLGVQEGFSARPLPFWQRPLLGKMRPPDPASVAAGLLLSAWLGQGEGQARMERALVTLCADGAKPPLLDRLFGPLVAGLDAALLARLRPISQVGPGAGAQRGANGLGGSNAWAVGPAHSRSGAALLAGDPHQPIGALPGMFFEVRVTLGGGDFLLGGTVPGLPGFVVGRNRTLAWSGTFAFADNFDWTVEDVKGGKARRATGASAVGRREVVLGRRLRPPIRSQVYTLGEATFEAPDAPPKRSRAPQLADGLYLAGHWAAPKDLHHTLAAFLRLPSAPDVASARALLAPTHALNLQFVLADAAGNVGQQQAGALPRRPPGQLGLVPQPGWAEAVWQGIDTPAACPVVAGDGVVVSANDGALPLATLPQPDYRADRIRAVLARHQGHDVASFSALQNDLYSLQAAALVPTILPHLPPGELHRALAAWDFVCTADAVAPHGFALAYDHCLAALAPWLGGARWLALLGDTELKTWWCKPLDQLLLDPALWQGPQKAALRAALAAAAKVPLRPWGQVQKVETRHEVWGRRAGRGPLPLAGTLATVCQGNVGHGAMGPWAIAPALRMVCDFATDGLYVALPGGIAESPRSRSYARWLPDWQRGQLHLSRPPTPLEAPLS